MVWMALLSASTAFTYVLDAYPPQSTWYHAHTATLYGEGIRGPLIILDQQDPFLGEYSEEIVLFFDDMIQKQDWVLNLFGGGSTNSRVIWKRPGLGMTGLSDSDWLGGCLNGVCWCGNGSSVPVISVKKDAM